MVPIHVQEKGSDSMDRLMAETGGIRQTSLRSSLGHTVLGMDLGEFIATLLARTNGFGPNPGRSSSCTTVDIRLSLIGAFEGRLTLSLSGFPELKWERGFSLHRTEREVVCSLVPPVSPMCGHVLPH